QFQPLNDADGDGLLSSARGGLDPNDATWDNDKDGLADAYELEWRAAGVPYSPLSCDTDGDGLTDKQEAEFGSNPGIADSDNDGIKDGDEVWHQVYNSSTCQPTATWRGGWDIPINGTPSFTLHVSSNPLTADSDRDGISDLAEQQLAGKADSNNVSYNPNAVNTPPLAVFTDLNDRDRIVAPDQSLRYTTTVVAAEPVMPGVLDVTAVTGSQTYALNFNASTFNGSQSVDVITGFQAPIGNTQPYTMTSSARTRLYRATGPAWAFDPIVSETPLSGFAAPYTARYTALAPATGDRTDSYRLLSLNVDGSDNLNRGDVHLYQLPSGQGPTTLENDSNNQSAFRERFPANLATNNRGTSFSVWRNDTTARGAVRRITYRNGSDGPNTNGFATDLANPVDTFRKLDINGDGKDDLIWFRPGGGYAGLYRSNGDGAVAYTIYKNGAASAPQNGFVGDMANTADKLEPLDINGDGKD
ncbi:MAG: hypothetical protein KDE50_06855, partial [Caldilineaceae bacterium]|nr:hypothetical protein [Caldilineaceae bacterium]